MSYGTTDRITITNVTNDNKLVLYTETSGENAIYSVDYNWTAGKPLRLSGLDSVLYLDASRATLSQPWGNFVMQSSLAGGLRFRAIDDSSVDLPLSIESSSLGFSSDQSSFGGSTFANQRLRVRSTGNTSSHYPFAVADTAENALFYIRGDGYGWINQAWGVGSDARLKEDIQDLGSELERLRQARFRSYRRLNSGRLEYGVVAQELQAVYPELVTEHIDPKDAENPEAVPMLAVDYQGLAIAQGRALQELAEKLDAALARIAELEARG